MVALQKPYFSWILFSGI